MCASYSHVSVCSAALGELIFSIITLEPMFMMKNSLTHTIQIVLSAYLFKLAYGVFAIVPSTMVVYYLKRTEEIDVYDHDADFNIFKIQVQTQ